MKLSAGKHCRTSLTMHTSDKHQPRDTFQKPDPFLSSCSATTPQTAASELMEDPGNCRQHPDVEQSLHLLTDSVVSETRRLRHVLNWAETFLCSRSEDCNEFCRADGLLLADVKPRETDKDSPAHESSSVGDYHPCTGDDKKTFWVEICEVCHLKSSNYEHKRKENNCFCGYKPLSLNEPLSLCSYSLRKDEETWLESRETANIRRTELQHAARQQTSHQDRTRRPHTSDRRLHKGTSLCGAMQTLASDAATQLIRESGAMFGAVSTRQTVHESSKIRETRARAQPKKDESENQLELKKVVERRENSEVELKAKDKEKDNGKEKMNSDQISSSKSEVQTWKMSHRQRKKTPEQEEEEARVKLWRDLTVLEQYQLCVDQLHLLRTSRRESAQKQTSVLSLDLDCHIKSQENKNPAGNTGKMVPSTEERGFYFSSGKRDGPKSSRALTTHECDETESCDHLTMNITTAAIRQLDMSGEQFERLLKKTANQVPSNDAAISTPTERLKTQSEGLVFPLQQAIGPTAEPGSLQNKIRRPPSRRGQQGVSSGPRRTNQAPGPQRPCENSSSTSSGRALPSDSQSKFAHSAKLSSQRSTNSANSRAKQFPSGKDTQRISTTSETHKLKQESRPPAEDAAAYVTVNNNGYRTRPAGVPACGRWLWLPDEVWLSVLSLVPHKDLCSVSQVCHRLRVLSNDHSLWKYLKMDNSAVTDQWFLSVGRRRPHSLCLHSCSSSSPSASSCGLQMFFSLCRNSLKELKVTSCTGPGLHGDQVLSLMGQLCETVTSVDVSWSGATDMGLTALSDCSESSTLRLKSVLLNGCHITDVPLKKLVMKHKESLHRLEIFGCQFLSSSCLLTVFELCLGLQHLNIGRVPKVSIHSFTVMASQLKLLISLNLTGLQVVDDTVVVTVLQNCAKLGSLTLSSCSGVTDVTLHNIRKYTPCIRSLDVSGCAAVTDEGLQSLALGCRRLEQLDLSSTGTGNRGLCLLANYCSTNLHTVKLSFCHVTAENILKLCRNCRRLKVLHVYGCVHLPTHADIRVVNSAVTVHPSS